MLFHCTGEQIVIMLSLHLVYDISHAKVSFCGNCGTSLLDKCEFTTFCVLFLWHFP